MSALTFEQTADGVWEARTEGAIYRITAIGGRLRVVYDTERIEKVPTSLLTRGWYERDIPVGSSETFSAAKRSASRHLGTYGRSTR